MKLRHPGFLVGLFVFFLSSFMLAQERPVPSNPEAPAIKSRTQLVVVPVVVTDKSNNHVTGLKKDDFVLLQNSIPQDIAFFEEVKTSTQRTSRTKPRDDTFSNMLQAQAPAQRVTILLIDLLNTRFFDQKRAREAMIQSLSDSLEVTEPTALYVLTRGGLKSIHDFTTKPEVLVAAIKKLKGSNEGELRADLDSEDLITAAAESQELRENLEQAIGDSNSYQWRVAAETTLSAMQQLAKAYAGLPGRKAVIWATGSFPFHISDSSMELSLPGQSYTTSTALVPNGKSRSDLAPLYERAWKDINNANFAIYPVDVRGLNPSTQFDVGVGLQSADSIRNPTTGGIGRPNRRDWAIAESQETLRAFANATGGKPYYNSNDIAKGFSDAARDSANYYLLACYLYGRNVKAGWHRLHVKLNRGGMNVRARSGFWVTEEAGSDQLLDQQEVSAALGSPIDYTEIPFRLTWVKYTNGKDPGKRRIEYEVFFPTNAKIVDETNSNYLRLQFIALARLPDGKVVGDLQTRVFEAHLSSEQVRQGHEIGLRYRDSLELPAGEYTVRFVVRDALTGRMGTLAATLTIDGTPPATK